MMKPNTAQQTQAPNPLIHADGNGYGWVSGTVLSDDLLRRILFFAPARQGPPRLALAVLGRNLHFPAGSRGYTCNQCGNFFRSSRSNHHC
jgi:hypothetical protein